MTEDPAALNQWYVVGAADGARRDTVLLGRPISIDRNWVSYRHTPLPSIEAFGLRWATLGSPERGLFALPEAAEPDRRRIYCGAMTVHASGLRLIENFLDLAHFPYVHTDILGAEAHPEVARYEVEHRRDVDELWATKCEFFQPRAAASSEGGQISRYMYRVVSPFNVMLYKTPPTAPNRWDVIALFVQPVEPELSIAHMLMLVIDDLSTDDELIAFQQMIFMQDKIVLENQRPLLLPLQPGRESPTRADLSSVLYRRWLKDKQLSFGVEEPVQLA
jgi:phenylpropionate dioxygenase-like ring-hydroxylating dioxygenase large terminal subunit